MTDQPPASQDPQHPYDPHAQQRPPFPPPAYAPPAFPHPPAPEHVRRSTWSWRAGIAGAVAGGLAAATVAVPVTWALTDGGSGAAVADPGTSQVQPRQGEGSQGQQRTSPFGGSTSDRIRNGDQADATAAQSKGVVLINTVTTDGEGAGTGLVLDSSGLVLTNYHVVEGSTTVKVTVASTGDTYDAKVLGHDQTADIALLQLDGASGLPTVTTDDDEPAVSDDVTAVGNAQGQGYLSASSGRVVALDQSIDTQSEGTVAGEHLTGLIQTDAYVVGGYSGGALLDDEGEVVGITTAASSGGQAESYGIPIDTALDIAQQIEDGDESAAVQVGPAAYLGVSIPSQGAGTQVAQVQAGSAAADAGVQAGATITGIGDTDITSYDVLRSALATHEPGDHVVLRWTDSSGGTHRATVTLGESPVN